VEPVGARVGEEVPAGELGVVDDGEEQPTRMVTKERIKKTTTRNLICTLLLQTKMYCPYFFYITQIS
jgi:hypothetical protein